MDNKSWIDKVNSVIWSEATEEDRQLLQELFPADKIEALLEEPLGDAEVRRGAQHDQVPYAADPTQLAKSHIADAVESVWSSWFPSRCLDTIYRKLLYYLSARGVGWDKQDLMTATLIVPLHLQISADRDNYDIVGAFCDAALTSDHKCLVHPLYDEPYPADWNLQGELFSTVVNEPIRVEQDHLLLFLIASASGHGPVRALGLYESNGTSEIATGPCVFRLNDLAEDITEGLEAANEAELIGSTLRYWVGALFEHLTTATGQQLLSLPTPPRPDLVVSHPGVVQRSFLPRFFQLIQTTLRPDDPDKIACYLVSPSLDGTTLYTLGKSENYPPITMPDIRLLTADGMNWDGMGLTGRAEVYQHVVVSRFGGIDITPEDVRDTRPIYARHEGLKEAVAVPIRGGSEKASGLGVAVHSDHSYADLYVYTKQRGLLKSAHILWLRELATIVGEYFGWASASSMRERQLARDREVSYRSILADVDSERSAILAPLLQFIAKHVAEADQAANDVSDLENSTLGSAGSLGMTFLYIYIAGDQQTTGWYRHGETSERVIFRVKDMVCTIQKHWMTRGWITDAETVCYQGGLLGALTLTPAVDTESFLVMVHRYLSRCRCDWGIANRPTLGVLCFQRDFDEIADLGFETDAGATDAGLHTLHLALRRFNRTLTRFRKAFEQMALITPALSGYIAVEDSRTDELRWLEPQSDEHSRSFIPQAEFDKGIARVKRVGIERW